MTSTAFRLCPERSARDYPSATSFAAQIRSYYPSAPADIIRIRRTIRRFVFPNPPETELIALLQRVRQQRPAAAGQAFEAVSVLRFQQEFWGILGTVLFGVVNLLALSILLLAAVNVGNLLLARTNARIKEIGVRVALGAPRLRLIVQTTLENVILCAIGGVLAIFLAARALEATGGFMNAWLDDLPFWWTCHQTTLPTIHAHCAVRPPHNPAAFRS